MTYIACPICKGYHCTCTSNWKPFQPPIYVPIPDPYRQWPVGTPGGVPEYPTNMGWQCPICKTVHAPFVKGCYCAATPKNHNITTTNSNGNENILLCENKCSNNE